MLLTGYKARLRVWCVWFTGLRGPIVFRVLKGLGFGV